MTEENKDATQAGIEAFEQTLTKSEQYVEENQNGLLMIVAAIIVVVGGYFAYQNLYMAPKQIEATEAIYKAEQLFEKSSYTEALNGDEIAGVTGFLDIINEYGGTPTGNLAHYYAGICYLRTGDYENAITYLDEFKSDDKVISSVAQGAIGDAFLEQGDQANAMSYYMKAAETNPNQFVTPIYLNKAALLASTMGDNQKALSLYERIKEDYSNTREAQVAEKNIARLKK